MEERHLNDAAVARGLLKTARAGTSSLSDFSLLACNEELLVAAGFGRQRLSYTLLEGSDCCQVCGSPPTYKVLERKLRAHVKRRTVAVSSWTSCPAGWMEVPPGTALTVDSGLNVHFVNS
jgi:hypothetical protein